MSSTLLADSVEVGRLVEKSVHAPLGARAVVAEDVEDEGVVHLAQVLDGLDQPAGLVVGELAVTGEHLHLVGEELLLVGRQLVPILDRRRFGRELVVSAGTTPSFFCRASVSSRSLSQPWSNWPLYLAIHSFGTWCGAWVAPGAK